MPRFRIADLPLAIKIGVPPALSLALAAVFMSVSFVNELQSSAAFRHVVDVQMPHASSMNAISEQIEAAHGELYRVLTDQAAKIDVDQTDAAMKALSADFDHISHDLRTERDRADPGERPLFDRLIKQVGDVHSATDLISAMIGSDFATAAGFAKPFEGSYDQMTGSLHALVAEEKRRVGAEATASYARVLRSIVVLSLVATLVSTLSSLLAVVSVVATRRDVKKIAGATEQLAGGDTDLDLDSLARRDELGAVVASLGVFRDNQKHLAKLRVEQEQAEAAAAAARAAKLAEDEARAQESRTVVANLAEGLSRLADGDLTYRIAAAFPLASQKLKDDFNATMDQLQGAVAVIVENASRMRAGAGEISHAADDLSRRTEQQGATLEETASALDQITITVRKTAEGAAQARRTVSTTKGDAEKSGAVVREAVDAMGQIERSASEIGQIIGVIDEIAFQTNLLALNAGVEAARAGDAGRGFAVVASEVRALAQRSAQAAKEIKALISASSQQVRSGVNLVGQTGEALGRIVVQVSEINALVLDMAASAEEQAGGLQQVNTAVNQMDQVTQQNAAMVEESTAASHALALEAQTLTELVSRFRLGEAAAPAVREAAPRPALRPPITAASRSSALRKPQPLTEEEGWEEF